MTNVDITSLNEQINQLKRERDLELKKISPPTSVFELKSRLKARSDFESAEKAKLSKTEQKSLTKLNRVGKGFWFFNFLLFEVVFIVVLFQTSLKNNPGAYFITSIVSIIIASVIYKKRNSKERYNKVKNKLKKNTNIELYFVRIENFAQQQEIEENNKEREIQKINEKYNTKIKSLEIELESQLYQKIKQKYNKHIFIFFKKNTHFGEKHFPYELLIDEMRHVTGTVGDSKYRSIMLNPGVHLVKWQALISDTWFYLTFQVDSDDLPAFYTINMDISNRESTEITCSEFIKLIGKENASALFGNLI